MTADEFYRQVRDALEHLYEPACLEVHPLLSQIADTSAVDGLTRAQRLRGLLRETIEALRPQQGPPTSQAWRSYLALRHRYAQGMSMGETADELGLSLRQTQRELRKGLDALTALLWERHLASGIVTAPQPALAGQAEELRHELEQWKLARQSWEVQALADDTLWMLKPLLQQHGVTVRVELPADLPHALVDSTLTRQALYQILRMMVQNAPGGSVLLQAGPEGSRVAIILSCRSEAPSTEQEGWQTAELMVNQQGGTLVAELLPGGWARVKLALPAAAETRVLVIDDNQAIHQLFERYLSPQNYRVTHAYSGPEALRQAVEAQPDLITLDVMMPNVDGWQVLRDLVENPATARIPIVVCSVLKEPELAFNLGARAYLKKPVDRIDLLATLAHLRPAAGPAEGASPPARRGC